MVGKGVRALFRGKERETKDGPRYSEKWKRSQYPFLEKELEVIVQTTPEFRGQFT
jgi:hypothetical protein